MTASAWPSTGRLALLLLAAVVLPPVVNLSWLVLSRSGGAAPSTGAFWALIGMHLALVAGLARLARHWGAAAVCAGIALVMAAGSAAVLFLAAMAP